MTWTFHITTGEFLHNGLRLGTGYSGMGDGKNNAALANVKNVGPCPPGIYDIADAHDDLHLGPCIMRLTPQPGTNEFGRSGFFIHGDNADHDASHGCIVLGPAIRRAVATSHDKILEVLP